MPVWIVQSSLQKLTNPPFCLWRRSLGVHSVDIIWESKVTSYLFWVHPSSEHSSAARISVTGLQGGILLTLQTDSNLTEIDRADVGQSKYRSWPHKKHSTTHTYTHSFYHCSVSCFFPVPQPEEEKSVLFFFSSSRHTSRLTSHHFHIHRLFPSAAERHAKPYHQICKVPFKLYFSFLCWIFLRL